LYSGHGTVRHPMATFLPVTDVQRYHSLSPSPYRDVQPPPPPPPPVPQPQPLVPLQQQPQQPIVPPLPPKTPNITSVSPTVPPKPPPLFMPPQTIQLPPKPSLWPIAQPPPPLPPSAPPPLNVPALPPLPPMPPMPPPKPLGSRSRSFAGSPSAFPKSTVLPRASPSLSVMKPSNSTNRTVLLTVPQSVPQSRGTSPVESSLGMNEEDELKIVLELSARAQREHDASFLSQDEEFARAVEASLKLSPPAPVHPEQQPNSSVVGSESVPPSPPRKPWDAPSPSPTPLSHGPSLSLPSPVDDQLEADEALARKLEAEYENEGTTPMTERYVDMEPGPSTDAQLPRYADVVGKETATRRRESDASSSSPRIPQSSPTPVHSNDRLSVPDQANTPPRSTPSPVPVQKASPRPESLAIPTSSSEAEDEDASSDTSSPSPRAAVTPNHFVEPELLYGVSFGFHTPPMENLEMRGPLPHIISLPFGKCPPMHIRAPSWRQLLKMMAKLSGTRIEPSVEALAVTKGELQLRTVIQFFKPHHASLDWRTVIYLTIDYPPPADYRVTNGDVNALPYSYSLSTVPAMLRDGCDSQLSKFYTVPATSRLALPKLPISMPSLAMYLASALGDSRRALNDSSSGVRRLAKMVNQYYPNQENSVEVGGGQGRKKGKGGRALIGRLMGRQPRQQGGNAEVFDLVTPFVPDEWG